MVGLILDEEPPYQPGLSNAWEEVECLVFMDWPLLGPLPSSLEACLSQTQHKPAGDTIAAVTQPAILVVMAVPPQDALLQHLFPLRNQ